MKRNTAARAIQEQVRANRSGLDHGESFAAHRERVTAEIVARAPRGSEGRLCLLGAGNSHDVDLAAVVSLFGEVHLVDIDADALRGARARLPEPLRDKIRLHAPVDVSGSWDRLAEWAQRASPDKSLPGEVAPAVQRVLSALPGPFDVVVSCCMLTQMQLSLLDAVDDRHPAFHALRSLINAIHVRVLVGLLNQTGSALLLTDLTSDLTYPLDTVPPGADLNKLMSDLVAAGNIIYVTHPGLLSAEIRRDPRLSSEFTVRFPVGPWLWQNGPDRLFLVYGLDISRVPSATAA